MPEDSVDKLETRLLRELDRRFGDTDKKIDNLEKKMEERFNTLDNRKHDNNIWIIRYGVSILVSLILGAGAVGAVQFIERLVPK